MGPTNSDHDSPRYARPTRADRLTARLLRRLVRMGVGAGGPGVAGRRAKQWPGAQHGGERA